jgi:hypothetical protein
MRLVASSFLLALAIVTDHALATGSSESTPTVDLGYAVYEGVYNDTYNLNTWKR